VLDGATGERVNPPRDIKIGRHVWLAHDHIVLGGADIGSDSIVAARTLVPGKRYPPQVLLAGTPARVVRQGVSWTSDLK